MTSIAVSHARQIVSKLLADKLTFTSEDHGHQPGFRFRATGTIAKLVDGLVPGRFLSLRVGTSPTGSSLLWHVNLDGIMLKKAA